MEKIIRVLIAKPGLDGHDRGAKVVARGLRDQGFEVIYTGLHQTPEMVVSAALQEDVDIVGLSILSGAHIPLVTAVKDLMKKKGLNKPVFVGGIIPGDDAELLQKRGVAAVFGPGTPINEIADQVRNILNVGVTQKTKVKKKTKSASKKKSVRR
jgi:methylmalonyl-CoA mutase, C-terminal domain